MATDRILSQFVINKVENEEIMAFAGVQTDERKERTADDIFNEYL